MLSTTWTSALAKAAKEGSRAGITVFERAPHADAADAQAEPFVERTQSFAVIEARSRAVAVGLQERGVSPGDAVMVIVSSPLELAAVLFGLARLGAVPILVPHPQGNEEAAIAELADVAARSRASLLVASQDLRKSLVRLGAKVPALARVTTAESLVESSVTSSALASLPAPSTPLSTFFVQYAHESGPHGIELTNIATLGNVHALGQAAHVSRADRLLQTAPAHQQVGLAFGLLFSVYWCVPLTVLPLCDALAAPEAVLPLVAQRGITIAPLSGPLLDALSALGPEQQQALDLSKLRLLPCVGEESELHQVEAFVARYESAQLSPQAAWPVYGVAEASLILAAPEPGAPLERVTVDPNALARGDLRSAASGRQLSSVGASVPGHRLLVVDADGDELDDGHIGHVVVSGPSLMRGYWREPEPTAHVLQDGWLWTGDLGFARKGRLTLSGRARHVLTVDGKNHHVGEVEREVEIAFGLGSKAAVFVVGEVSDPSAERIIAVVESRHDDAARRAEAKRRVQERFGFELGEVVRVSPGRLLRSAQGAASRVRTRERLLDGSLGSLASRWVRRLIR